VNCSSPAPFEKIEAAQEYLTLLSGTVTENREKVEAEIKTTTDHAHKRHTEVLLAVIYNLEKLERHLKASRQALSNLRKLRGVLWNESTGTIGQKGKDETDIMEPSNREVA